MLVFHNGAGGWVSEVLFLTDARRVCSRCVIRSPMGVYPRCTGSNPVERNRHYFPSWRQLYMSYFTLSLSVSFSLSLSLSLWQSLSLPNSLSLSPFLSLWIFLCRFETQKNHQISNSYVLFSVGASARFCGWSVWRGLGSDIIWSIHGSAWRGWALSNPVCGWAGIAGTFSGKPSPLR